jgi:NitT/TauT family transport system permease protein
MTAFTRPEKSPLVEWYQGAMESRWTRVTATTFFRLLLVGMWLGVWELLPAIGVVSSRSLPPPSDVFDVIPKVVGQAFWGPFSITLREALAGFVVGGGSAMIVAILLTLFPKMRFFLTDYILALQALPKVLLIPVIVTWFGFDEELFGIAPKSKIVLAALIAFFPVYINAMVGMNRIEADEGRLMRVLEANRFQRLVMLQIPKGTPTIFAGLKNGATNALIGATVAEFLGASQGLGVLIIQQSYNSQFANTFVVIGILTLMTMALFYLVDFIGNRVAFWVPR